MNEIHFNKNEKSHQINSPRGKILKFKQLLPKSGDVNKVILEIHFLYDSIKVANKQPTFSSGIKDMLHFQNFCRKDRKKNSIIDFEKDGYNNIKADYELPDNCEQITIFRNDNFDTEFTITYEFLD